MECRACRDGHVVIVSAIKTLWTQGEHVRSFVPFLSQKNKIERAMSESGKFLGCLESAPVAPPLSAGRQPVTESS